MDNLPSALLNPDNITKEIAEELSLGRLRQVDQLPSKYYCSPIGLTPKRKEGIQTGWRRIFHLSSPDGDSVNDHIPKEYGTLAYETFRDAVKSIAKSGKGSILLKRDLKAAFRKIPVCKEDQWLLLFEWAGHYYQELFLPFGLPTAPFIFNLFREALRWILQRKYAYTTRRYLDDFLLVLPPRSPIEEHSARFQSICKQLGFAEAQDKKEDGTCVHYLGLILDIEKMEARVPEEKINQAIADINQILEYTFIPMKKLQELLGLLEFCVAVFPIGHPFLRHVWNTFCRPEKKTKKLSKAARQNLRWWKKFLPIWSSTSVIQSE